MKRLLVAALALACAPALAQKLPSDLSADIDAAIKPGVAGGITATTLNTLLKNMNSSYGGIIAPNTWTAQQSFDFAPIFTPLTGYLYCNGAAQCTSSLVIPNTDVTGLSSLATLVPGTGVEAALGNATNASGGFVTYSGDIGAATAETLYGGSAASSVLYLRSTSAVGTSDAINFITGDNAVAGRFDTNGNLTLTKGIVGKTDASNATAGLVGEVISAYKDGASVVSLTTGNLIDITSITLTAGDWDVWGAVLFGASGQTTGTTLIRCAINTTSATFPAASANGYAVARLELPFGVNKTNVLSISPVRINVNASTTVYLIGSETGDGTLTGYGAIVARRRR